MSAPTPHVAEIVARLRAAGCVFAEEEAALLLAEAAARTSTVAGGAACDHLEPLLDRRLAGEPLEHVLGWVEFLGRRYAVAPGVFVPRRRTELLVETAVGLIARGDPVIDLCCGCGAIGAAIAAVVPGVDVHASDVDPAAVAIARRNLPPSRVVEGDFLDPLPVMLRGSVALIVCNAPYVPTAALPFMPSEAREHEPQRSLDGGRDGLDWHRRLAREARDWLGPGGHVLVEAAEDQAPVSAAVFEAAGFAARIVRDDEREATAVVAAAL